MYRPKLSQVLKKIPPPKLNQVFKEENAKAVSHHFHYVTALGCLPQIQATECKAEEWNHEL